MLNMPRSLYNRRPQGPPGGGYGRQPGGGGGMNRLAQMNPGMMSRLMRRGQPGQQAPPQNYGGVPAPVVPFQGGQPGGQPPPQGAGPVGMDAGGGPDMAMMGDALKKIFGPDELPHPGQQWGPGQEDPTQTGMDPAKIQGILKMLPMLMGG